MKTRQNQAIGLISVVIPALNEERLLPACLQSLHEQDYQGRFEIIIADNGSTDGTAEVAASYGARVVPCPEKKSVFYARQVGADAARGEIIAQADADSIYPPDWVSRIADLFATRPDAVAVTGRFVYKDPPIWAGLEYRLRKITNTLSQVLLGRPMIISGATFAFRRIDFIASNGYYGLTYAADQYGIATRLQQHGKVRYDDKLKVITSARSVEKPFSRIIFDFACHIGKWARYCSKCTLAGAGDFVTRSNSRRLTVPVSVMLIGFLVYGYVVPQSTAFGKVYSEAPTHEKLIALTFDDGPNEPYTSQILDILDQQGIKATFFLVGKNVLLYPSVAQRMVQDGHLIGNHTYSHIANHALTISDKDIALTQDVIQKTTGLTPHFYRPPHGKKSPWEIEELKRQQLIEVTWTVSANELRGSTALSIANKIAGSSDPGEIILLHDGYGTDHNIPQANKSLTVATLPLIIDQLKAKGYRFVTVSELLNIPAYNEH